PSGAAGTGNPVPLGTAADCHSGTRRSHAYAGPCGTGESLWCAAHADRTERRPVYAQQHPRYSAPESTDRPARLGERQTGTGCLIGSTESKVSFSFLRFYSGVYCSRMAPFLVNPVYRSTT